MSQGTKLNSEKLVYVVLENCYLETARIKDGYRLLSGDEHHNFLRKNGRNPELYRPDIVHHCLMTLMDSPLNKANHLRVYMRTHNNILIYINPQCRIPRTYKRFCVQLLHKLKIKAANSESNVTLMKVVKNPVTNHLPTGTRRVLCTQYAEETVHMGEFVQRIMSTGDPSSSSAAAITPKPVVFFVGGFAHTEVPLEERVKEYGVDHSISVSSYPLSAAVVCAKITNAFEELWDIL